jgi:hypothetical protein
MLSNPLVALGRKIQEPFCGGEEIPSVSFGESIMGDRKIFEGAKK